MKEAKLLATNNTKKREKFFKPRRSVVCIAIRGVWPGSIGHWVAVLIPAKTPHLYRTLEGPRYCRVVYYLKEIQIVL